MPSRTEAARRLFAVLEAHGWTDGDRVRLAPLLRHLNAHRQLVTRGALTTVLYGGREPTAALVSTLARRLSVPLAQFHAPRPPKPGGKRADADRRGRNYEYGNSQADIRSTRA
jgi:hypothetical protein